MRLFLTLFLALEVISSSLFAQVAPNFWVRIAPEDIVLSEKAEKQMEPLRFKAFKLDYAQMAAYLNNAPREFTAEARQQSFLVSLPLSNGKMETFAVAKTRVMAASLEALHPEIGTYAGSSLNDPGKQVRITVTPGWGFRAMITRADKGVEYVEPVAEWQNLYYMAYDRTDLVPDARAALIPFCKELHDDAIQSKLVTTENGPGERGLGGGVNLKVYRFACAATGEFTQDNGGTKDLAFQKITTLTNQLNSIYERDINIRVELIAQSYDAIFLDPATDPYLNFTVGSWMQQNSQILGQVIGAQLYDIGHVLSRHYDDDPNLGIAILGSCCSLGKGAGCSSWPGPPYGDEFLGIVAHEMGHQWSAGHTFNQCNPGDGFSFESACEPGGGNTILAYNYCGANNTTGDRDLYYHACTIGQIRQFVETQTGATCGTELPTTNNAPMVSTAYPVLTYIPISTPFELTGISNDPDGDALTYTWDQIDLGPSTALGSPIQNSPLFRWYEPTPNPTRTFPNIQTVISNNNNKTEVLPTYNREINLVFVARDNRIGGGGIAWDTVKLKSTTTAGPFLVTYPNEPNLTWKVGEYQTILWDVANTNRGLVNAKTVNIRLSTDNGLSYPISLATGVPNNGKYCIQTPNNVGSNMRIRIEAADNVFFDISNNKFAIVPPTAGVSLCTASGFDLACLPTEYTTSISTVGLGGSTEPIALSASGLPSGASATFSPNPVQPGSSSIMTVSFPNNSPENTFDITVLGNAGTSTASSSVTLTVVNNDFAAFAPISPANGAQGVNQQPGLFWSTVPDADAYDVQLASNPAFEPTDLVTSRQNVVVDSFQSPVILQEGQVYYWRVRPKNNCGDAAWSEVQAFVVAVQNCSVTEATDLPKNISANGTPTVESKITLNAAGIISDLNVKKIQGNHSFFRDLEVRLVGPTGTEVLLWKDKCASFNGSFNIGMDDGAPGSFNCPPPNNGLGYKPLEQLSAFNGQSTNGVWTLRVKDNTISSGGTLSAFALEICSSIALNPPTITVNNPLSLASGTNAFIDGNLLTAVDPPNGTSTVQYTLMSLPKNGELTINGAPAKVGAIFFQSDIDSGNIRYYDYALNKGDDNFKFSVKDNEGGLAVGTFLIQPFTVGTQEPDAFISFNLAPNPASATALLRLNQTLTGEARVTLLNVTGQVVQTWQLASGANNLRMDLSQFPKGVYAVALEHEKLKTVKKLVVQ